MNIFDWLFEIFSAVYHSQAFDYKNPVIPQDINRVRNLAKRKLGENVVKQGWLDQPLLDGLSPWQLVMNGQTQKVVTYLRNCPRE